MVDKNKLMDSEIHLEENLDEAAEIMGNLSPKEVQVLGTAMYSVQGLGQGTVNLVLDEFLAIIKSQTSLGISGGNYIKNVLTKS